MMEEATLRKDGNCSCGSPCEPEERAAAVGMEDTVFIELCEMMGCGESHEKRKASNYLWSVWYMGGSDS